MSLVSGCSGAARGISAFPAPKPRPAAQNPRPLRIGTVDNAECVSRQRVSTWCRKHVTDRIEHRPRRSSCLGVGGRSGVLRSWAAAGVPAAVTAAATTCRRHRSPHQRTPPPPPAPQSSPPQHTRGRRCLIQVRWLSWLLLLERWSLPCAIRHAHETTSTSRAQVVIEGDWAAVGGALANTEGGQSA